MVNEIILHIPYDYFWSTGCTAPVHVQYCLLKKVKSCMDNPNQTFKTQAGNTFQLQHSFQTNQFACGTGDTIKLAMRTW